MKNKELINLLIKLHQLTNEKNYRKFNYKNINMLELHKQISTELVELGIDVPGIEN